MMFTMCLTYVVDSIRTGVKGSRWMFEEHRKRIEDRDFGIQFVALAGYSVLRSVLKTHEIPRALNDSVANGDVSVDEVYERLLYGIPFGAKEPVKAWDGSLCVYLHCLAEHDWELADKAADRVLEAGGLFWAGWMARAIASWRPKQAPSDSDVVATAERKLEDAEMVSVAV